MRKNEPQSNKNDQATDEIEVKFIKSKGEKSIDKNEKAPTYDLVYPIFWNPYIHLTKLLI